MQDTGRINTELVNYNIQFNWIKFLFLRAFCLYIKHANQTFKHYTTHISEFVVIVYTKTLGTKFMNESVCNFRTFLRSDCTNKQKKRFFFSIIPTNVVL